MTDGDESSPSTETEPDGTHSSDTTQSDGAGDASGFFTPSISNFPWIGAAVTGVLAFLGAYVLVALLFVVGPASFQSESTIETLRQYGFVLYNAHNVPLEIVADGLTIPGPSRRNVLTTGGGTVMPVAVYYAVPILSLLVAGATFEWVRPANDAEEFLEGGALVGIGLAVGYLLVALVGTFVFVRRVTAEGASASIGPVVLETFLYGAVYALVLGTVGALAVRAWRRYA